MDSWGVPCRQDEHQVLSFCVKLQRFFFLFGTFLQEKLETNTFDWNHRLKNSGQELKSTEEFTGKILGHSHYLWPVRSTFWMSSCREPTCPLFWLEQELKVEGEQVKYFKF